MSDVLLHQCTMTGPHHINLTTKLSEAIKQEGKGMFMVGISLPYNNTFMKRSWVPQAVICIYDFK